MPRRATMRRTSIPGLLLATAVLAACGGGSDDGGTAVAAAGQAPRAGSGAGVAEAEKLVALAADGLVIGAGNEEVDPADIKATTSFAGPAPAAPPSEKPSLAVIGCAPTGGCLNVANEAAGVAEQLGWTVTQASGNGTPTTYQQLYDTAISQGADAILGISVPGVLVSAQLAEAKKRGIVTVVANGTPLGGPGYAGYVDAREALQKTLLASWIVADSDAQGSVVFADAQGNPDLGVAAGVAAVDACDDCSSVTVSSPIPDFLNPVTAAAKTQAMVQGNADAGYLVWPTGGLPMQPAIQGLDRAGRGDRVKIVTSDLDPGSAPLLAKGDLAAQTVVSQQWVALAAIDAVIRGLTEQKLPGSDEWGIGVALVEPDSVPDVTDYRDVDEFIKGRLDFTAPYAAAWGVDLSRP